MVSGADPAPTRKRAWHTTPPEIAPWRSFRPPDGQDGLQEGFQDSQDDTKTAQDGPRRFQRLPIWPQDRPRRPKRSPRGPPGELEEAKNKDIPLVFEGF